MLAQDLLVIVRTILAAMSQADRDNSVQLSEDCSKDGYVLSPNPELGSVLELSAPFRAGDNLTPVAAVTLAILDTKALQYTVPVMVSHLKFAVATLGRKIDIAMPSLAYQKDRH